MTTPRLGAPELATSQTNKEETVNEQIRYIESGAGHFIFKDRDLATPPGSPADGDCYLVAGSPTGAWAGHAGDIAFRLNTAWVFIEVIEGFTAWVNDENVFIGYDGAAWNTLSTPSGIYQPLDADLTALAGLTSAADKIPYFTGSGAAALLTRDTDGTLAANSDTVIATQKATKTYVDAKVAGLSWKQAVRAATTANGTLATAFENGDTLDGVTLATGDRILIKNQSTGAENGIYTVNASGAPTRATDADSGAELVNASVYVSEGTTNADTQWSCTTNAPITPGSTSLVFAQMAVGGATTSQALTITNTGGAAAGTTFDGSVARTIDYSTVGAAKTGAVTGSNLTMATSRLLGRTTASTGAIEEITVGSGLTLSGGSLSASGGGGASYEAGPPGTLPTIGSMTSLNLGTSTNQTSAHSIQFFPQTGSAFRGYYQSSGGSTFDVYMRMRLLSHSTGNSPQSWGGILLRNSANSNGFVHGLDAASVSFPRFEPARILSTGAVTGSPPAYYTGDRIGPVWLRANVGAATITMYYSMNGWDWIQIATETISTHLSAVDQWGFVCLASDTGGIHIDYLSTTTPS